jgi:feruloyl-CoA synthase
MALGARRLLWQDSVVVATRRVSLGPTDVAVSSDGKGGYRLRSKTPLGDYPEQLTSRLVHWAREAPDRWFVARRGPDGQYQGVTFAQALSRAERIGEALLQRGLSAERPLMILSENDLEHAVLALAALHVGVPYVPVSPAYSLSSRDHERLRAVVRLMTPGLVFAADGPRYARALGGAVPRDVEVVTVTKAELERPVTPFDELLRQVPGGRVAVAHGAISHDSVSKFLLTSGSTGSPKAVIHTQRMLSSNQQMLAQAMPFLTEEPPVLVDWLPWHHTFGGNHNFGIALYNGGTLYIDEGKPTPHLVGETLRNLAEVAPTVYFNVPRGFEELAHALERDEVLAARFFSRIKLLFYAAASLPQPVWDALERVAERTVGERILMVTALGMTETSPFAMCANGEARSAGDVGLPAPGVEVKLARVDGKFEVRYRGPNVCPGYFRDPERTQAAFDEDGFYRSGDSVRFTDPADPTKGLTFDGRLAEDFKLDTGSWVSVGPLRSRVIAAGAPYVQDVIVTGHDRRDVGVLIVPHVDSCRALCPSVPDDAAAEAVVRSEGARAFFCRLVDDIASDARGATESIVRAAVLTRPPSLDLGELTDKGSINQRAVLAARARLVDALYGADEDLVSVAGEGDIVRR